MSFVSFLKGDLTCSCHLKALLGAGVCFYLRHYIICYDYSLLAAPHRRCTCRALWEMGRKSIGLILNDQEFIIYVTGCKIFVHHLLCHSLVRPETCAAK